MAQQASLVFFGAAFSLLTLVKRRRDDFVGDLWLEDVDSERSMAWVREQNRRLPFPSPEAQATLQKRILGILNAQDKIPYAKCIRKKYYYNFWQDENHVLGIWRRCTSDDYMSKATTKWETILDLDALNKDEPGNEWRWKGYEALDAPSEGEEDLVLLKLSRGGGDAVVVREFSIKEKRFLGASSDSAFHVNEAKTWCSYVSRDALLVSTDTGPGSLSESGYPLDVRLWKRGEPLHESKVIFSGAQSDMLAAGYFERHGGMEYQLSTLRVSFFTSRYYLHSVRGNGIHFTSSEPFPVPVPESSEVHVFSDQLLVELRSEWLDFPGGSLLSIPVSAVLERGSVEAEDCQALFLPQDRTALKSFSKAKTTLVVLSLENVRSVLRFWRYDVEAKKWKLLPSLAQDASTMCDMDCWGVNSSYFDRFWVTRESYTVPITLSIVDVGREAMSSLDAKQTSPKFDASGIAEEQYHAISRDGTQIPYFLVARGGASHGSPRATLLYGYGGFEHPMTPYYSGTTGAAWLEKGYVYVVANIRGGGEFGPSWHQAALKRNRNKAFEDFEAVAADLIRRGITTGELLAAMGGSNGGLLVGNMYTRMSGHFKSIVCQVPLLDMKRYSHLLAGASWMAEYGDPDKPEEWGYLQNYSPYHNIEKKHAARYPAILFTTSTRDDRVHPSHARRMAKKLLDMGCRNVYLFENTEGGHGGASTNDTRAKMWTLTFEFLYSTICR